MFDVKLFCIITTCISNSVTEVMAFCVHIYAKQYERVDFLSLQLLNPQKYGEKIKDGQVAARYRHLPPTVQDTHQRQISGKILQTSLIEPPQPVWPSNHNSIRKIQNNMLGLASHLGIVQYRLPDQTLKHACVKNEVVSREAISDQSKAQTIIYTGHVPLDLFFCYNMDMKSLVRVSGDNKPTFEQFGSSYKCVGCLINKIFMPIYSLICLSIES